MSPGGYDEIVAKQADEWLAEALATVADDVVAHGHRVFSDSYAEGLISEAARLEAVRDRGRWVRWRPGRQLLAGVGGQRAAALRAGAGGNRTARYPDSGIDRVREVTCAIGERAGADLLLETAVRASEAAGTPLRLVSLVALDPIFGSLRGDVRGRSRACARACP